MARGRRRDAWDRTAAILAKIHNVNQVSEEGLMAAMDFHPLYDDEDRAEIETAGRAEREQGSVAALATLIVGSEPNP
jgi:hypothetical protein